MSKIIPHDDIQHAIHDGIERAVPIWQKIKNTQMKNHLVGEKKRGRSNEQFFSSFIATELRNRIKKKDGFCTHETAHFVIDSAIQNTKKYYLPQEVQPHGKIYDIALWRHRDNNKSIPYALIEVKLDYRFHKVADDAVKLCKALQLLGTNANGSIKNVFLAFPVSDRETISGEDGIDEMVNKLSEYLDGKEVSGKRGKNRKIKRLLKKDKTFDYIPPVAGQEKSAAVIRISSDMVIEKRK